MSTATDIKHIVRDPDVYDGKPCIDSHRIAVHDVAAIHNQGYTPEEIARDHYPTLTLAQVYAALLYYYEHKDEIDHEIDAEAAWIKERAMADMSPLAQKSRAAIAERKRELGI
jgi:uncharacterized protein (DUF433 family)